MSNEEMLRDYHDMMISLDPDSPESIKKISEDPTQNINSATILNFIKSIRRIVIKKGNKTMESQMELMHEEALMQTEFDDVTNELSALYNCSYKFKKAEMDMEAIAIISQERIEEDSINKIDSHLESFKSSIETAVTRAFGMLSSTAKYLIKNVIPELADLSRTYASRIKEQFFNTYNKMVELFFQLLNEFVSKVFSFSK